MGNFWLAFFIFFGLMALVFFFSAIATKDRAPRDVSTVIDAAFDPDVEDLLEFMRQGIYGSVLPDTNYELAQLAYEFLTEWAAKGERES